MNKSESAQRLRLEIEADPSITLQDAADILGVSVKTVSNYLNPEHKSQISKIELKYFPVEKLEFLAQKKASYVLAMK